MSLAQPPHMTEYRKVHSGGRLPTPSPSASSQLPCPQMGLTSRKEKDARGTRPSPQSSSVVGKEQAVGEKPAGG